MAGDESPLRTDEFRADPFPTYRWLRDEHPVFFDESRDVYAVTRFADIITVVRDPTRFSSAMTRSQVPDRITAMDPPKHTVWRALLADRFRARSAQSVEAGLRRITRDRLAAARPIGTLDLVGEYGSLIPSAVIGEMMGVPESDWPRCHELSKISVGGGPDEVEAAHAELDEILGRVVAARRPRRGDDLISALLEAVVEGRELTERELLAYCLHLIVAGNDTTANLIATAGVFLAGHPSLRSRLVEHPELVPAFVEEMLRYDGPTHMLPRSTTEATELQGVTLPKDAVVEVYWASGNRDERQFSEPDRFSLERPERLHVAFGHGIHFCLGAHLARLEAQVAIEELLAAFPSYSLAEEQGRLPLKPGWCLRGYFTAPIVLCG